MVDFFLQICQHSADLLSALSVTACWSQFTVATCWFLFTVATCWFLFTLCHKFISAYSFHMQKLLIVTTCWFLHTVTTCWFLHTVATCWFLHTVTTCWFQLTVATCWFLLTVTAWWFLVMATTSPTLYPLPSSRCSFHRAFETILSSPPPPLLLSQLQFLRPLLTLFTLMFSAHQLHSPSLSSSTVLWSFLSVFLTSSQVLQLQSRCSSLLLSYHVPHLSQGAGDTEQVQFAGAY